MTSLMNLCHLLKYLKLFEICFNKANHNLSKALLKSTLSAIFISQSLQMKSKKTSQSRFNLNYNIKKFNYYG